jgi:hypothetical protein
MADDAIALLRSIDKRLETLVGLLSETVRASKPVDIASEAELRGKWGDPTVRFDPRDWTGPSFKGRPMSKCPADFLDLYASAKDYFGEKAEREGKVTDRGKPVAAYERADAARARGWAKLIRDGRHHPPAPPPVDADGWAGAPDDDIPF